MQAHYQLTGVLSHANEACFKEYRDVCFLHSPSRKGLLSKNETSAKLEVPLLRRCARYSKKVRQLRVCKKSYHGKAKTNTSAGLHLVPLALRIAFPANVMSTKAGSRWASPPARLTASVPGALQASLGMQGYEWGEMLMMRLEGHTPLLWEQSSGADIEGCPHVHRQA